MCWSLFPMLRFQFRFPQNHECPGADRGLFHFSHVQELFILYGPRIAGPHGGFSRCC